MDTIVDENCPEEVSRAFVASHTLALRKAENLKVS
jgi:hypothetical protein